MNRRTLIIIGGAVILVAGITALLLNRFTSPPTALHQSPFFARNIQYPSTVDKGKILFFTGTAFAEYDLKNYTSRYLTTESKLPTVTMLRWSPSKELVLIQAKSTNQDELFSKVSSVPEKDRSNWWIVKLSNGSITPLQASIASQPMVIEDADWHWNGNTNEIVIVGQTNSDKTTQLATGIIGTPFRSIYKSSSASMSIIGWKGPDPIILESGKLERVSSNKVTIIGDKVTSAILNNDATKIAYIATSNKQDSVHLNKSGIDQVLNKQPGETKLVMNESNIMALNRQGELYSAKLFNLDDPSTPIDIPVETISDKFDKLGYSLVINLSPKTIDFIVFDSQNSPALFSSDATAASNITPTSIALFDQFVSLDNGYIRYDLVENQADIYLFDDNIHSFAELQKSALTQIASKKVDGNQIKKVWHSSKPPETPEGEEIPGE